MEGRTLMVADVQRLIEAQLKVVSGMNVPDIMTEFCGNLTGNINSIWFTIGDPSKLCPSYTLNILTNDGGFKEEDEKAFIKQYVSPFSNEESGSSVNGIGTRMAIARIIRNDSDATIYSVTSKNKKKLMVGKFDYDSRGWTSFDSNDEEFVTEIFNEYNIKYGTLKTIPLSSSSTEEMNLRIILERSQDNKLYLNRNVFGGDGRLDNVFISIKKYFNKILLNENNKLYIQNKPVSPESIISRSSDYSFEIDYEIGYDSCNHIDNLANNHKKPLIMKIIKSELILPNYIDQIGERDMFIGLFPNFTKLNERGEGISSYTCDYFFQSFETGKIVIQLIPSHLDNNEIETRIMPNYFPKSVIRGLNIYLINTNNTSLYGPCINYNVITKKLVPPHGLQERDFQGLFTVENHVIRSTQQYTFDPIKSRTNPKKIGEKVHWFIKNISKNIGKKYNECWTRVLAEARCAADGGRYILDVVPDDLAVVLRRDLAARRRAGEKLNRFFRLVLAKIADIASETEQPILPLSQEPLLPTEDLTYVDQTVYNPPSNSYMHSQPEPVSDDNADEDLGPFTNSGNRYVDIHDQPPQRRRENRNNTQDNTIVERLPETLSVDTNAEIKRQLKNFIENELSRWETDPENPRRVTLHFNRVFTVSE